MKSISEMSETQLTAKLMYIGISPKYKAFSYLIKLLRSQPMTDILCMSNKELIDYAAEKLNVSAKRITANFKSLMECCEYVNGERSSIYKMLACLDKHETPTLKEFIIAVNCILMGE